MTTAMLAAKLIQVFEGCRLVAYQDPTGTWTIGFGHTLGVVAGMTCTQAQADAWFIADSAPLLSLVSNKSPLEGAALVSFGYNCGMWSLANYLSGKIRVTNQPRLGADPGSPVDYYFIDVLNGLPFGERSKGVVLPGLQSRRALEAALIATATTSGIG